MCSHSQPHCKQLMNLQSSSTQERICIQVHILSVTKLCAKLNWSEPVYQSCTQIYSHVHREVHGWGKACHEVFMDKIVREIMEGCVRGVQMSALK